MSNIDYIAEAKRVFDIEINAITKTRDSLDERYNEIIDLILNCEGKVILTGMGKPGHIGKKIAATLASLGTPSFFMHPAEAQHGDLGMIEERDIVILMSYSGESEEITRLVPVLKQIGCKRIAISGQVNSTLARECEFSYIFPDFEEACYMHLAPTSSTTSLLVFGDALALTISRAKNYTKEDFGLHHPAGALGKKLIVKVYDIMHKGEDNATVIEGSILRDAIVAMSEKSLNMVTIVDEQNKLKGIITDGDLRRMLNRNVDVYKEIVNDVMTPNPLWIDMRELAVNALQVMNNHKITCLPVLNDNKTVVGSILMQDIFKAGIVK